MLKVLTSIVGIVARGPAAKAIAGGVATTVGGASFAPLYQAFLDGLLAELGPGFAELGAAIGAAIVSYVIGWAIVWISPANAKKG